MSNLGGGARKIREDSLLPISPLVGFGQIAGPLPATCPHDRRLQKISMRTESKYIYYCDVYISINRLKLVTYYRTHLRFLFEGRRGKRAEKQSAEGRRPTAERSARSADSTRCHANDHHQASRQRSWFSSHVGSRHATQCSSYSIELENSKSCEGRPATGCKSSRAF